ncbi:MAG: cell filamentation protein Fic [Rhodospirillaceae bacterium]|nr:MAG: cell filamentation protein Fic [Rhodospirillaceae bacterium]
MKMDYPEGATPLDPDEMEGLKFKHVTTRGELDQLEQANIQNGLVWLSHSREKDILSEAFVRKLHEQLFGEVWKWAGSFRRTGKNIGVDPLAISVELRTLLDDMRYWAEHDTYPEMEAAIRFHHRLVFIHPFPDGNGRHARIMTDAVLQKIFDKEPIDWSGGHDLQAMNERRTEYIVALRAADRGDYVPIFKFARL